MTPIDVEVGDGHVRFTGRAEGDLGPGSTETADTDLADTHPTATVERRRQAVLDLPWSWVRQVHGARVVSVAGPGGASGSEADALVTSEKGTALAIFTADCAPVALVADARGAPVLGAVHAGWRGLMEGVVDAAVDAIRRHGVSNVHAAVGPCIHAECYAFSPADLDPLAGRFGEDVRSTTADGQPALDLPATVRAALEGAGVTIAFESEKCTACSSEFFSHRARRESERQAMVIWSG